MRTRAQWHLEVCSQIRFASMQAFSMTSPQEIFVGCCELQDPFVQSFYAGFQTSKGQLKIQSFNTPLPATITSMHYAHYTKQNVITHLEANDRIKPMTRWNAQQHES